jgi:hypothetical protein
MSRYDGGGGGGDDRRFGSATAQVVNFHRDGPGFNTR